MFFKLYGALVHDVMFRYTLDLFGTRISMKIKKADVNSVEITNILKLHRENMLEHSPAQSVHAVDCEVMETKNITYWSAWINDDFAGCIALKMLDKNHGEIKSMKTAPDFLRRGVAKALVLHLEKQAKNLGVNTLSLETGTTAAFIPAHKLYQNLGFTLSEAFSDYKADPYSLFMSKQL